MSTRVSVEVLKSGREKRRDSVGPAVGGEREWNRNDR
jgi:hypothetical protein